MYCWFYSNISFRKSKWWINYWYFKELLFKWWCI